MSSTVVRHANCPVAEPPDPRNAPVLLGTDGSPASELATEIAFDEASRRGVDLVAFHAWSDAAVVEVFDIDWPSVEGEAERSLPRASRAGKSAIPTSPFIDSSPKTVRPGTLSISRRLRSS